MDTENKSLAIFIDAENISEKYAKAIFNIASKYGDIVIKRIFGDWTKENIRGWKEQVGKYSIVAMQQFNFASGKNSSDMYLITEVMSIFYEKDIDIFVIVSSDSDYTNLVQRLRENKKQVIGMGLEKSIKSYTKSFNEFFYLDFYTQKCELEIHAQELIEMIKELMKKKERLMYSEIYDEYRKKHSNFRVKKYGFKSVRALVYEIIFPKTDAFEERRQKNIYFLVKNESNF